MLSSTPSTRRHRLRNPLTLTALATALVVAGTVPAAAAETGWAMGEPRLPTPWTAQVSPDNALPEYPRPQLVRPEWRNLNGVWEFAGASPGEAPPVGHTLAERVLVPYPIESVLSGIERHEDYMWYRRTFAVPPDWRIGKDNALKLHFGAVDYKASVWVNGTRVADHQGGFGAFSADVTAALRPNGDQEIIVGVEDRTDGTWQPVGKQRLVPDRGIFYEGASGIWQTVWAEPVPTGHVETLDMTPDVDTDTLALTVRTGGTGLTAQVTVKDGRRVVSRTEGPADQPMTVRVPDAKLWSPDTPFLYDLDVVLKSGNRPVDQVSSYFGMREIGTTKGADGKLRITLNGKILFLLSTLDQGYWPDGIFTAPTDAALRFDLEQHKVLGFNTVRKHIKTEPDRWYHHADKLGLLVWQDMPAMRLGPGRPPVDAQRQFEVELRELVEEKKNWTSVIGWVPFNEGWGEWSREATGRIADEVKAQDPSRLVNAHSGVNCCASLGDSGKGDVIDWHQYVGPATPAPDAHRVSIDGEHGGFGLEVEDHMWFEDGHAYEMTPDRATLTRRYVENQRDVLTAAQGCAISGSIYTQITDVEHEVNGFFTYDRQVEKMDFAQVRAVNDAIVRNADGSGDGGTTPPDPGTPGTQGVHAYEFDEGSGSTATDSVGDADAAVTNGEWVAGVQGGALSFTGTGQADTDANLIDTAGSYSVSAWVKLDEAGGAFQTAVSQDSGRDSGFFLQYAGQERRWAMSIIGTRAVSAEQPVPGRWYHLTGVRDARAGTLSLYLDGQHADTEFVCRTPESGGDTVIGRAEYGSQQVDFLRGDIDGVRIFDRALSAAEIAALARP